MSRDGRGGNVERGGALCCGWQARTSLLANAAETRHAHAMFMLGDDGRPGVHVSALLSLHGDNDPAMHVPTTKYACSPGHAFQLPRVKAHTLPRVYRWRAPRPQQVRGALRLGQRDIVGRVVEGRQAIQVDLFGYRAWRIGCVSERFHARRDGSWRRRRWCSFT